MLRVGDISILIDTTFVWDGDTWLISNDEKTLKQITNRNYDKIKHEGARPERQKHNVWEHSYAKKWKEENHRKPGLNGGYGTLESLLSDKNNQWQLTQRDAYVAATLIQFLGTNGGSCLLWEVERNATKLDNEKKIKEKEKFFGDQLKYEEERHQKQCEILLNEFRTKADELRNQFVDKNSLQIEPIQRQFNLLLTETFLHRLGDLAKNQAKKFDNAWEKLYENYVKQLNELKKNVDVKYFERIKETEEQFKSEFIDEYNKWLGPTDKHYQKDLLAKTFKNIDIDG